MSDAERVARHAIRNAMTATSDVTGLRAGPGVDRLVDQILVELLSPPVRWAILDLAAEACATSPNLLRANANTGGVTQPSRKENAAQGYLASSPSR
jgi:hypothetical protein